MNRVSPVAMLVYKGKPLDPGLRRDDICRTVGLKTIIPAQAGIQWLTLRLADFDNEK